MSMAIFGVVNGTAIFFFSPSILIKIVVSCFHVKFLHIILILNVRDDGDIFSNLV